MLNDYYKQLEQYAAFTRLDISSASQVEVQSGSQDQLSIFQWQEVKFKSCFNNSAKLCLSSQNIEYCIGYALSVIPMEHSWISIDNQYFDPTWEKYSEIGKSYMLLRKFNSDQLFEFLDKSENYPPDIWNMITLGYLDVNKKLELNSIAIDDA